MYLTEGKPDLSSQLLQETLYCRDTLEDRNYLLVLHSGSLTHMFGVNLTTVRHIIYQVIFACWLTKICKACNSMQHDSLKRLYCKSLAYFCQIKKKVKFKHDSKWWLFPIIIRRFTDSVLRNMNGILNVENWSQLSVIRIFIMMLTKEPIDIQYPSCHNPFYTHR